MLSTGMKIFRQVSKNCFTDFLNLQGWIDEKYVIKLKQICFFISSKLAFACCCLCV